MLEEGIGGLVEGAALPAVAVGAGVLYFAPGLLSALGRMARPLAVGAIKTGIAIYEETAATVRETTGDLVAEARSQLEAEGRGGGDHHRRPGKASERPA